MRNRPPPTRSFVFLAAASLVALPPNRAALASPTWAAAPSTGILISEVEADPPLGGTDTSDEWFEVHNPTGAAIDLSGWTVSDNGSTATLPSLVVPVGGTTIMRNGTTSQGLCPQLELTPHLVLRNAGDHLILRDHSALTVDAVSYGDDLAALSPAPPTPADNTTATLQRSPPGQDTDTSADWANDRVAEPCVPVPNQPPVLDRIGDRVVDEGRLLELTVTASDPDVADVLTYSATGIPSGSSFSAAMHLFSWTPSFGQAGVYPDVEFSVDDGRGGTDSEAVRITVNDLPQLPSSGPKEVRFTASRKLVERGQRVRLTARVAPCAGHEGDVVVLRRGTTTVASAATTAECTATFTRRVRRRAVFRAVSPRQDEDHLAGTSNAVTIRVRRR